HDAWRISARAALPWIADGWRLDADADASHSPRFGNPDLKATLSRQSIGLELTRRIVGPLHVAARLDVNHLSGAAIDLLSQAFVAGSTCPDTTSAMSCTDQSTTQTDSRARLALILDTRDREYDTQRGTLIQGGYFDGEAAEGYTGTYALASGWVSPFVGTRA